MKNKLVILSIIGWLVSAIAGYIATQDYIAFLLCTINIHLLLLIGVIGRRK